MPENGSAKPDYRFRWNGYNHPNLRLAYDMGTLTLGGLMRNLAKATFGQFDGTITNGYFPQLPLIYGKKTPSMLFNNTQYITLANPIIGLNPFSIVCWYNPSSYAGGGVISSFGTNDAEIWTYPNLDFSLSLEFGAGAVQCRPRPLLPVNTTYMMAFTLSSTKAAAYVNGELRKKQAGDPNVYNNANVYLGRPSGAGSRLKATLDNYLLYNIELTPEQVKSLWRSSVVR